MKKKILGSLVILALATVVAINVSMVEKGKILTFTLSNVEAMADNEINPISQWLTQGLTKDEETASRVCATSTTNSTEGSISVDYQGIGISFGYSTSTTQENPPERFETYCEIGEANCTPAGC